MDTWQLEPKHVCTLDTIVPIVGGVPLAWSEDNCIAVGTETHVLIYELNPFDTPGEPIMHFKTETIGMPSKLDYDCGIQAYLDGYDEQRNFPVNKAFAPDYDIYSTYLDPSLFQKESEDVKSKGAMALAFSPNGCSKNGNTLFAFLSSNHRLQIYAKKCDGGSIRWMQIRDISSMLVDVLKENNGFYPLSTMPFESNELKMAWNTRYAACIDNFMWTSVHMRPNNEGKSVFLITSTKMNFLIVWKLSLPVSEASSVDAVACIKAFDDGTVSCIVVYPNFDDGIKICAGNSNGRIVAIALDHQGHELSHCEIWDDADELTVHCMDWQIMPDDPGCSVLIVGKSFAIMSLTIHNLQKTSYFALRQTYALNIGSIVPLDSSVWIAASKEGKIGIIRYFTSSNTLTFEDISEKRKSDVRMFRETVHSVVVSPNKTFLAILRSNPPSRLACVMDDAYSHVDISTFMTGTKSFEVLCNQDEKSFPFMDALESVRLHLLLKDLIKDPSEHNLFSVCVEQCANSPDTQATFKWCYAQIGVAVFKSEKSKNIFSDAERSITIRQMVYVLEWVHGRKSSALWAKLPIKGLLKFLKTNLAYLDKTQSRIIDLIEGNPILALQSEETCSVTGEPLIFSANGRRAITTISRVEWPRCCLTFRALQEFRQLHCEVSKSSCAEISADLQELQHGRCLYTGLPMI